VKKLILILLFLIIYIQIFSIQSKKNLVKIDIIGKSGIKSYYVKVDLTASEAYKKKSWEAKGDILRY